jgi:hypothetical protein
VLVTFTRFDDARRIALRVDFIVRVNEDHDKAVILWHDPNRPDLFSETERVEESFDTVVQRINEALAGMKE